MAVDIQKAKEYFGENPLTHAQIKTLKRILNSKMATWWVEKQSGNKLSKEEKNNLLEYLKQEEKRTNNG